MDEATAARTDPPRLQSCKISSQRPRHHANILILPNLLGCSPCSTHPPWLISANTQRTDDHSAPLSSPRWNRGRWPPSWVF